MRDAASTYPSRPVLAAAVCVAGLLCAPFGHAQIRTDGSVGPAAQNLAGPAFRVPQALGRLAGGNLFHSFSTFNVANGESVTFTTSTPGIANVISRVTGGQPSQINGPLRLTAEGAAPDFFLINPAGLAFGRGAVIDVPASFHVATADYVGFGSERFHADLGRTSSFSSARPEAFGFLGTQRAAITLRDAAVLQTRGTGGVSVAAGDIHVDQAAIAVGTGEMRVLALGGEATQVGFSGALPTAGGKLTLDRDAALVASTGGAADAAGIRLGAGQIAIDRAAFVYSTVAGGATGAGGPIDIAARDGLALNGLGNISSDTASSGSAGAITLRAGQIAIDGGAYVFSSTAPGSTGRSGAITVAAAGTLRLDGNASISSVTFGSGRNEAIHVQAQDLGIASASIRSDVSGPGGAAGVRVDVGGRLTLDAGGRIASSTDGGSDAAPLTVRSGSLDLRAKSHVGSLSLPGGGRSGAIDIAVAADASLSGEASVFSSTSSSADAGLVRLSAANLQMDAGSVTSNAAGDAGADGAATGIEVTVAGAVRLENQSAIDTSTVSNGSAGRVQVRAGEVFLGGGSRISSSALSGGGDAGQVNVAASGALVLRDDSSVSTSTSTSGHAGTTRISAQSVLLDAARIDSTAFASGNAGNIVVVTPGALTMHRGASISAHTGGSGSAGNVSIDAASVFLEGGANIGTVSAAGATGDAGRIALRTPGDVSLRDGAFVSSDAFGQGAAGSIAVQARDVTLDLAGRISSVAFTAGGGDAGRVEVVASGTVALLNSSGEANRSGQISTSTFGSGQGGPVSIRAANVLVDGAGAGVVSFAHPGSTGGAGQISLDLTGELRIAQGGLSSTTGGAGPAGSVNVRAARVEVDGPSSGVSAAALAGSGGQVGNVQIAAADSITLANGAFVSIGNDAVVADPAARRPTALSLSGTAIRLDQAVVTAESRGNVAASDITVTFARSLTLDRSAIATSANDGDGGSIRLRGGEVIALRASRVTTSVLGVTGDGGDITIEAGALALDTGFIQANTAARNASGGRVRIDVDALIASGNALSVAANAPFDFAPDIFAFNVVQAAAPTGVSGIVQLTSPVVDVTGSLRGLRADVIETGGLGRSPCQTADGSSLALAGRGGLAPSTRGLLRAESPTPEAASQRGAAGVHATGQWHLVAAAKGMGRCR